MRFVPVKTAERQGEIMVLRNRELLVRSRTQAVNALRGHATEFGLVVPLGVSRVAELLAKLAADPGVPEIAREMLALLGRQIEQIDTQVAEIDARLLAMHKTHEVSRRLAKVPGTGPITAVSLALNVEAAQFESGRHLAAWLGLTPRAHSSGGKQRLGGISRAGHERLRQLLVVGAMAFGHRARNPSGPAAVCRANRPETPPQSHLSPNSFRNLLHQGGRPNTWSPPALERRKWLVEEARDYGCAPMARVTSGGGFHPDRCRLV